MATLLSFPGAEQYAELLGNLRQEDYKFKTSMGVFVRLCLKMQCKRKARNIAQG